MALSGVVLPRLRRSRGAGAFLDGLNVASLALMATVSWELARTALVDWRTLLLAAVRAGGLAVRINSAWLVLGGGLAGYLLAPDPLDPARPEHSASVTLARPAVTDR